LKIILPLACPANIRIFSEGGDIRHLDHNTTARTGVPHVRTFRDEREKSVLLLADFRAPMLWRTRRVFRSVAATGFLSVHDQAGRVGWASFLTNRFSAGPDRAN
jgi:uncharacterized protein (DUF58 family)